MIRFSSSPKSLELGIEGFTFKDLYDPLALQRLHDHFESWLAEQNQEALTKLRIYSANSQSTPAKEVSDTIIEVAPYVGQFVSKLFQIEAAVQKTQQLIVADAAVFEFKKQFAKKASRKGAGTKWKGSEAEALQITNALVEDFVKEHAGDEGFDPKDEELVFSKAILEISEISDTSKRALKGLAPWSAQIHEHAQKIRVVLEAKGLSAVVDAQANRDAAEEKEEALDGAFAAAVLDAVEKTAASRLANPEDSIHDWYSFKAVHKVDYETLVPLRRSRQDLPEEFTGHEADRRERTEPFALTDKRGSHREVANEVDYCIYCHGRDKDSCSKGLHDKDGSIKKNPLGVELHGCPLDEKISEMHTLRKAGEVIGSLATVTIDNPMAPGTGHRICNDCMKGCIYQTQEPVNIPQIETKVLTDVLDLPWGFEIYAFLTRWNPLRVEQPYALPFNGKKVLVVGLGPAGYTLSHWLANEGFGVVGVDGLKLEPLPKELVGSSSTPPEPIFDYNTIKEKLESRTLLGFGGVSEYGITVRWDKNFLTTLYLNLLRNQNFRTYGGIRFGGTLTVEDAWDMGFDHIAIASGAGKPTYISMKNNLIRGVRKASDFLMGLQLTGAYKRDSLANLQVRLPAVVIGGGLTAIDTATELLAYYVVQAERTFTRYEHLKTTLGEDKLRAGFDKEEMGIIDEIRAHGEALMNERTQAVQENRKPNFQQLLQAWGGVSLVYRRRLKDSPAYRLNHEEVTKSLEEGLRYIELMSPLEVHPDAYGAAEALTFERMQLEEGKLKGTGEPVRLPAKTICVAAGTKPNIGYENEYEGTFELGDWGYFKNFKLAKLENGKPKLEPTTDGSGFFTSYEKDGHLVSYYGDNHPKYAGSVVKAMASGKHGYKAVADLFSAETQNLSEKTQLARDEDWRAFGRKLNHEWIAKVVKIERLSPGIVEVVVRAPMAARKFEPGQFYRLQNFEAYAPQVAGTPMLTEGLALTGAWVDKEKGLMSTIALEMGTSSRMLAMLKKDEPVLLMGPTGEPTLTPPGEKVLLAGGGLGNAVLFSIAKALKNNGSDVLYFAGYRLGETLFKREEIEASTDKVIWATDAGAEIEPQRPQDNHFRGNIVQAMVAYQNGELGEKTIELSEVDRIIAIGSDRMMAAVKEARHGVLAPYLKKQHTAIGSINSPMQCMLKAVCAQCLQKVVNPETGEESVVYICVNQDQPLDAVDFPHLNARLRQNSAQEKLSNLWFEELLRQEPIPMI